MKHNNILPQMRNLRGKLLDYVAENPGKSADVILENLISDKEFNCRYLTCRKVGYYLSRTFGDYFRFEYDSKTSRRIYFVDTNHCNYK